MTTTPTTLKVRVDTRPFRDAFRAMARTTQSAAVAYRRMSITMHHVGVSVMKPERRRRHARRCHLCTPFANPLPLCIDGHAYRARTRNRRGRRR